MTIAFRYRKESRNQVNTRQMLWTAAIALGVVIAYNMAQQRGGIKLGNPR